MRAPNGEVYAHWSYLYNAWQSMGPTELSTRKDELNALLRENGVTYNIYSEAHEKDWPLDILPVVISSSEWATLERGLIQRAELQSLLFKDIYGPQRLIAEGILPPEFVFGHPEWLPSACPPELSATSHIPLSGFDLTRGPDGQWRVLADRVQNPSGAGYALQNRVLMAKVFPSLYREAGVHRLVHWFRALRAELRVSAPAGVENPHVVLLSPGPGHETWFEHSYLATYMGLTLVRGQDLELRGDKIWVRAVGGDRPVDVILRRVNDAWCDPLYLKHDSLLGVPGLVRAVQAGTVTVVNPLGAGVLNSPGLLAFLPNICRHLLGEDLILPSLSTSWCGSSEGLKNVLANLPRMVIKNIYPSPDQPSILASSLDRAALSDLRARIEANPSLWVGQEECLHSVVPAWQGGFKVDRHMVLRTFACGNPQTGYRVMPGGLTRIGASEHELVVSNQDGGISKDTWIISSEPERERLNRDAVLSVGAQGGNAPLPAAAAESLFWAGRYLERALVLIRRLREVLALESESQISAELSMALSCASGGLWNKGSQQFKEQLSAVTFSTESTGSIAFDLYWLVWNGRSLRGVIGSEAMGIMQRLAEPSNAENSLELVRNLDTLAMQLRALSSTFNDWSQDDPRRIFTELGRKCEWLHLALLTLQSVRVFANPTELRGILEVDQGAPPSLVLIGEDVVQQAVNDTRRPRSLASTVESVLALLERLPRSKQNSRGRPEALALRLLSNLALEDIDELPAMLEEFDSALHDSYFVAQTTPGWLQG